jgi:hypothetical protein
VVDEKMNNLARLLEMQTMQQNGSPTFTVQEMFADSKQLPKRRGAVRMTLSWTMSNASWTVQTRDE